MRQAPRKRSGLGGPTSLGACIAQRMFASFCNGVRWRGGLPAVQRVAADCCGLRPPLAEGHAGLACAAIPPAPPSNVFQDRGTPPVPVLPPAGGCAPACTHSWGNGGFSSPVGGLRPPSAGGLAWSRRCPTGPPFAPAFLATGGHAVPPAGAAPPAPCLGVRGFCCGLRPPSAGGLAWRAPLSRPHRPPTFSRTGGHPLSPPAGLRPCTPLGGNGGFVVACAHHQRGAWLGRAVALLAHPPAFLATGGHAVPPAGAAPPAPCLGTEGDRDPLPSLPPSTRAGTEAPRGWAWGWDRCEARSSAVTARS